MKNNKFLILPILHLIITFFTDKLIFNFDSINFFWYAISKIFSFILILLFWNVVRKVLKKDVETIKKVKYFLIYFIPLIILLFLIWPGYWSGSDVVNFLKLNPRAEMLYYLNYLTSLFNIISYNLFFCPTAPIILQVVFASCILSYITNELFKIFKTKYVYLIYVPFFLPITLCYMLYSNRQTIYGLVYLLFIAIMVFDKIQKRKISANKLFFLVVLISILSTFRTEGIYLIIIAPLLLFLIYDFKKKLILIYVVTFISTGLIYMPQLIYNNSLTELEKETRNLPTIINPLAYMLTKDLQGNDLDKKIEKIGLVLDIELLKKYPSLFEAAASWEEGGALKEDVTKEEYSEMKKSYYSIIKDNFPLFLKCKLFTFYNSTGLGKNFLSSYNKFDNMDNILGYKTTAPINKDVRRKTLIFLEGRNIENGEIYAVYKLFNNLVIPIMFISLAFLLSIFNKKIFSFLLTGMLLGHCSIVLLTAPANYFMYYYSIYLSGWLIGIIMLMYSINICHNGLGGIKHENV